MKMNVLDCNDDLENVENGRKLVHDKRDSNLDRLGW